MERVQCPNCGGYRVETKITKVNQKTGREYPSIGCGGWFILFILGPWPMALGVLLMLFASDASDLTFEGLIFLFGLIVTSMIVVGVIRYLSASKIEKYYHTCILCGYKWSRREDEPLLPVTLRPDLIAKGEQRLREEQEAEEWARHAAAAEWWRRQQRKK